jgi:hypothetical protein
MMVHCQLAQRDALSDYFNADIRIFKADHPTRLAFLLAYRDGLREGPAVAWNRALDMARERFPRTGDHQLQCMLLLALGMYDVTDCLQRIESGHPPDLADHLPVLIKGRVEFRLPYAARHFGLTADELASRLVGAWMEAACDFAANPPGPSAHGYLHKDDQ